MRSRDLAKRRILTYETAAWLGALTDVGSERWDSEVRGSQHGYERSGLFVSRFLMSPLPVPAAERLEVAGSVNRGGCIGSVDYERQTHPLARRARK